MERGQEKSAVVAKIRAIAHEQRGITSLAGIERAYGISLRVLRMKGSITLKTIVGIAEKMGVSPDQLYPIEHDHPNHSPEITEHDVRQAIEMGWCVFGRYAIEIDHLLPEYTELVIQNIRYMSARRERNRQRETKTDNSKSHA